jgi:hypothetical protein
MRACVAQISRLRQTKNARMLLLVAKKNEHTDPAFVEHDRLPLTPGSR